jgi:acyl-CoA thioesterase II
MDAHLTDLLRVLELERLEKDIFRGVSRDVGSAQVFGGQVLGQALRAAYGTVEPERNVHSMHAYFLRRGDINAPIIYFVDRSRDGQSFTSRRVTAIQHGEQIFHMSASFQTAQSGIEHQTRMPDVPAPESLPKSPLISQATLDAMPEKAHLFFNFGRPFDYRAVPPTDMPQASQSQAEASLPSQNFWLRTIEPLPDDDVLHRYVLAYLSDFHLIGTAVLPHVDVFQRGKGYIASIDHAMWFHRPIRVDEWFLCSYVSPSASGSRGFARGSIYTRDGVLAATTAQEGLVRVFGQPTQAAKRPL